MAGDSYRNSVNNELAQLEIAENLMSSITSSRSNEGSVKSDVDFDVKEYENYQNLQSNNFYIVIEKIAVAGSGGYSTTAMCDIGKSYDSNTGILTITIPYVSYDGYGVWLNGSVYLKK